ncbi:MAG: PH domain-containing protein [Nanoarchaeota archaeon]|nr:PH domain-containing protein [Nanoarchaeota archaeon]
MEEKRKRNIVRSSRKGYIPYYLMVVVVMLIILYIIRNDLPLNRNALIIAVAFMILILKLTEVHRITHYYELTPHMLLKSEGIFVHRLKKMSYGSMSQIHLNRSILDKIIGIGTIEIAQFSETVRTEIKNINKPEKVLYELAKRIKNMQE